MPIIAFPRRAISSCKAVFVVEGFEVNLWRRVGAMRWRWRVGRRSCRVHVEMILNIAKLDIQIKCLNLKLRGSCIYLKIKKYLQQEINNEL